MTNELPISGATLIDWGYKPGCAFPAMMERAGAHLARGATLDAALLVEHPLPAP